MENASQTPGPVAKFDDLYRTACAFLANPCKLWDSDVFELQRLGHGLILAQPDLRGGQFEERQIVRGVFLVSCCDAPEAFDSIEDRSIRLRWR